MCRFVLAFAAVFSAALFADAQDTFRWIDFHKGNLGTVPATDSATESAPVPAGESAPDSAPDQDQRVIMWVTRSLQAEKWTAIREIGILYDAALVVTTERAAPDASPSTDTFHIWSVSLKSHLVISLIKGVNLHWLEPIQFSPGAPHELTVLYDDCSQCAATTYFTAFFYDTNQHIFSARWMRGDRTVPVWTTAVPQDVIVGQVYAVLPAFDGGQYLATWSHFDFGKQKPAEDYVYRYDRDPIRGLDRFQVLTGKDAEAMKDRLCGAQPQTYGLARGQDSDLCQQRLHPHAERKPVTSPPANNKGRSNPPGTRPSHN
ncbi:MAG TPA: hypothetical protein VF742_10860 [Terracidiphilus sp.]|jgi:hypothetical protein